MPGEIATVGLGFSVAMLVWGRMALIEVPVINLPVLARNHRLQFS
jgi:hypothetical protein